MKVDSTTFDRRIPQRLSLAVSRAHDDTRGVMEERRRIRTRRRTGAPGRFGRDSFEPGRFARGRFARGRAAWFGGLCCAVVSASAGPAVAQSWPGGATRPLLLEIGAVDASGESGWLFGAEDVAGDGLDRFTAAEQSIDFRTVYAAARGQDLWLRAYVSSTARVGDVRLFVFVDGDRSATTGGSAAATDLDSRFVSDPTNGGYEYAFAVDAAETVVGAWAWSEETSAFEAFDLTDVEVEAGTDIDPIRIGQDTRAYLQLRVPLTSVGLTGACEAPLFVRSVNETPASLGDGDLDVGLLRCVPEGASDREPPAPLASAADCTEDAQCPGDGLCVEGRCVAPPLCRQDQDCAADETCTDGVCVFSSSTTPCSSDAACGDLVCDEDAGTCAACTGDASCGGNRRCAVSGRCVGAADGAPPGVGPLEDGEKIQGGAFTCAWLGGAPADARLFGGLFALFGAAAAFGRRRLRGAPPAGRGGERS